MALNLITTYPGKIDSTQPSAYPQGAAQNITVPGDGTGTPWEASVINDLLGFEQALLKDAGIVESGNPDTADVSDYLDAVKSIIKTQILSTITASGVLSGLTVENEGGDPIHDIQFNAGSALDSGGDTFMTLSAPIIKKIDALWVEGTNMGGLFSGALSASTTYHLFIIRKDSNGTIDAGFSIDLNAADAPAGWSKHQRVASLKTDALSQLYKFQQIENYFFLKSRSVIIDAATGQDGDNTLLLDSQVPHGDLDLIAMIDLQTRAANTARTFGLITGTQESNITPSADGARDYSLRSGNSLTVDSSINKYIPIQNAVGQIRFRRNTTGQAAVREYMTLQGWVDHRN